MNKNHYDSMCLIHKKLNEISSISLDEFMIIASVVRIEELNPGDLFIQPGESSQKVAFLLKGLAKTYYILENSKSIISHFGIEGSFVGVYTDMLKNIPSTGYIEAIEPCSLLVMNYQEMLDITKNSLSWAHLLRTYTEKRYIYRSDKERNITQKSALEKYKYFSQTHPDLIDRLPQNQIALYLNINPATLSRLKNNTGNYKK